MGNKRTLGYKHTPESKQKISSKIIGKKYSEGRRTKMSIKILESRASMTRGKDLGKNFFFVV
jgi:hypothetical protein